MIRSPNKLLLVSTDYFTAGATWQKLYGIWSCTQTDPTLHWMKGMSVKDAQLALLKMGAEYQWIDNLATHNGQPVRPARSPSCAVAGQSDMDKQPTPNGTASLPARFIPDQRNATPSARTLAAMIA